VNNTVVNVSNVTYTPPPEPVYDHNITLGKYTVEYFDNGTYANLTNCGEEVYGPVLVTELKRLNANHFELIVTNNSDEMIGGCKDVVVGFPGITKVRIFTNASTDQGYSKLMFWTPKYKLIKEVVE
jgi:hypothetical protein